MRISNVVDVTGISKRTIHFYIQEGLVNPDKTENNYYDFSEEDIKRLRLVTGLRNIGLSINSIRSLFSLPATVNYELYSTINRLKNEITQKQTEIERLLEITEQVSPNVTVYQLEEYLDNLKHDTKLRFDINSFYPTNNSYMATIFLCVPFVLVEPTVYQRYLWNKISENLGRDLGDSMNFLNKAIDRISINDLNSVSGEASLNVAECIIRPTDEEAFDYILNELKLFESSGELIEKWHILYEPLVKKIDDFYMKNGDLFTVYNSNYGVYMNRITSALDYLKEHHGELLQNLEKITGEELYPELISVIYTFRNSFYNLLSRQEISHLINKLHLLNKNL